MAGRTDSLKGTTNAEFQIGRRGPRIFQGTADPTVASPGGPAEVDGDLYIRHGTGNESVWQFQGSAWVDGEDIAAIVEDEQMPPRTGCGRGLKGSSERSPICVRDDKVQAINGYHWACRCNVVPNQMIDPANEQCYHLRFYEEEGHYGIKKSGAK